MNRIGISQSFANPLRAVIGVTAVSTLVLLGVVANPQGAQAYGILSWPEIADLSIDETWTWGEDSIIVTTDTPTFRPGVLDEEEPEGEYEFGLQVRDETETTIVDEHLESVMTEDTYFFSEGSWTAPSSLMEYDNRYTVRFRVILDDDATTWSDWRNIDLRETPDPPTLTDPPNDEVFLENPILSLETVVSAQGPEWMSSIFRVETSWQGGAPIEVGQYWGSIDENGDSSVEVTGLPDGLYRWQAMVSDNGWSDWTSFRTFRKVSPPAAPRSLLLEADGRHAIDVSWLPPLTETDGYPIEEYVVTLDPGEVTEHVDAEDDLVAAFTDLEYDEYTVTVHSVSTLGVSTEVSDEITLAPDAPTPPTEVSAELVDDEVVLTWEDPEDDGGLPITGYAVAMNEWSNGTNSYEPYPERSASFDAFPGADYLFLVNAANEVGPSAWEGTRFLVLGAPSAPTNLTTLVGDEFVDVQWQEPVRNNGAQVTGYTITASPGGAIKTVPYTTVLGSVRFSDLDNDTEYTFTVKAENSEGLGDGATVSETPLDRSTDTDEDGLPDVAELRIGTNIDLIDSDNDGLDDLVEVTNFLGVTDPLLEDSDFDETPDADEDSDEDGITNIDEVDGGTNPLDADSDHDGLGDDAEDETSAVDDDSDNDGITDGFEVENGLDPTESDSDSDSIPDAEEELAQTLDSEIEASHPDVEDVPETAVAEIVGEAADVEAVADLEINQVDDLPGVLTPSARVDGPEGIVVDSLTLSYSAGVSAGRLTDLGVMEYDEAASSWSVTEHDFSLSTSEQTITIESPTLGITYVIVDLGEWRAHAQQCDLAFDGRPPLTVHLVMDETSSVVLNDPTGERFNAVHGLLDSLRPGDTVSLEGIIPVAVSASGGGGYVTFDSTNSSWGFGSGSPEQFAKDLNLTSIEAAQYILDTRALIPYDYYDFGIQQYDDVNIGGWGDNIGEVVLGGDYGSDAQVNPYVTGADSYSCTRTTIVLVTDGEMKPDDYTDPDDFEPGYVPFRDRTEIPVHVLDVGSGNEEASEWLIDLADTSGGTYSYIPTAMGIGAWINDNMPEGTFVDDPLLDSDNDGVVDWVEVHGAVNVNAEGPSRIFSDPDDADTDNDGVPDGIEYGRKVVGTTEGIVWNTTAPIVAYAVKSNPEFHDGDGDGLADSEEIDLRTPALDSDFDNDQLDDREEFAAGGNVYRQNTDTDTFLDKVEYDLLEYGYDLTVNDPVTGLDTYMNDFWLGFWCGDLGGACDRDTPAWIFGNTLSGFAIFGDLRDFFANLAHGNMIMAAVVGFGLIPVVGDLEAAIGKLVKRGIDAAESPLKRWFALRSLHQTLPTDAAGDARFVDELFKMEPDLVDWLRLADDISDGDIRRLVVRNGPANLNKLRTFPGVAIAGGARPGFIGSGSAGEAAMRTNLGLPGATVQCLKMVSNGPCVRYADAMVGSIEHEAKVGWVTPWRIDHQLTVDEDLITNQRIDGVVYHFFASDLTGRIGARTGVIGDILAMQNRLGSAKVKIVIHLP